MEYGKLKRALEGILFAAGEPVTAQRLCLGLETDRTTLDQAARELAEEYEPILKESDVDVANLVKAADKLSAYIKCVEEGKAGNNEFRAAAEQILDALRQNPLPEVHYFMEHFPPAFELTLDELNET